MQTRTLVRAECIITQLIFGHSLRVRFEAGTKASSPGVSGDSSPATSSSNMIRTGDLSPQPPGGDSTINNPNVTPISGTESGTLHSQDETLRASSSSIESNTSSKKTRTKLPRDADMGEHPSGDNLVGKINNLVTTDLANIVEARDFLLAVVYIPLQITLCIVFLYTVLGWRSVISMYPCRTIISDMYSVRLWVWPSFCCYSPFPDTSPSLYRTLK